MNHQDWDDIFGVNGDLGPSLEDGLSELPLGNDFPGPSLEDSFVCDTPQVQAFLEDESFGDNAVGAYAEVTEDEIRPRAQSTPTKDAESDSTPSRDSESDSTQEFNGMTGGSKRQREDSVPTSPLSMLRSMRPELDPGEGTSQSAMVDRNE